eukprot:scaffold99238_cov67-Phaeocystis_antarctica.AAC.1
MSDVNAERAPGALMDPTDPWGTLGTHVVAERARAARASEGVSGENVVVGLQIAPIQNLFGLALSVARAHG